MAIWFVFKRCYALIGGCCLRSLVVCCPCCDIVIRNRRRRRRCRDGAAANERSRVEMEEVDSSKDHTIMLNAKITRLRQRNYVDENVDRSTDEGNDVAIVVATSLIQENYYRPTQSNTTNTTNTNEKVSSKEGVSKKIRDIKNNKNINSGKKTTTKATSFAPKNARVTQSNSTDTNTVHREVLPREIVSKRTRDIKDNKNIKLDKKAIEFTSFAQENVRLTQRHRTTNTSTTTNREVFSRETVSRRIKRNKSTTNSNTTIKVGAYHAPAESVAMNSTENGGTSASSGHHTRRSYSRESYSTTSAQTRRYTEPFRPSRTSQVSRTGAYRSLSSVPQYRRPVEYTSSSTGSREAIGPRRRTVSPDISLNSNFERMNLTGNGSISPASSTFTLSSQIVNHDFDFTVARLRFILDYTFHMSKLTTTISKVELTNERMIKDKECMEIDLVLLPDKRQSYRVKSKSFSEPHAFYIYPRERLPQMRLRFRLYESGRMRKRVLLAEGVFALKNVRLGFELITLDIEMFPPTRGLSCHRGGGSGLSQDPIQEERNISPVSMSTEASMALTQDAELLVSLQHRPSAQRLNVEVLKTRCCPQTVNNKPVSMYVELKIISSLGDLLFDTKTTTRRESLNPEFNEKFSFFLPDNNLLNITLLVTLLRVSRPFGRKSLVGRFSIGRNNSDKSEELHWNEVMSSGQEGPVLKWHKLYQL